LISCRKQVVKHPHHFISDCTGLHRSSYAYFHLRVICKADRFIISHELDDIMRDQLLGSFEWASYFSNVVSKAKVPGFFMLQLMAKTNLPLRTELDGVWYLESHPQVAEFFKSANIFDYCERLTSFNQPLAEAFAQSYNGRTVKFGREEFHVDEAAISECTSLPRTGQSWFKTTKASDIEFRSYLLPAHKEIIWRKDIPITFLEPQWQALLKAIFVYITCEG